MLLSIFDTTLSPANCSGVRVRDKRGVGQGSIGVSAASASAPWRSARLMVDYVELFSFRKVARCEAEWQKSALVSAPQASLEDEEEDGLEVD